MARHHLDTGLIRGSATRGRSLHTRPFLSFPSPSTLFKFAQKALELFKSSCKWCQSGRQRLFYSSLSSTASTAAFADIMAKVNGARSAEGGGLVRAGGVGAACGESMIDRHRQTWFQRGRMFVLRAAQMESLGEN